MSEWLWHQKYKFQAKRQSDSHLVPMVKGSLREEPDAVKVARPVCAVRHVVISLLEAGGMREDIPGLSVYLDVKAEGDKAD